MNETQILNSVNKIKRLIEINKNSTKLIEKRNELEALIFNKKQFFDSENANIFLKPEEKENATIYLSNKSLWYEDNGYAAPFDILEKEIKNITNYFKECFKEYEKRKKKYYERNETINKFLADIKSTQKYVMNTLKYRPWTREYYNKTFLKDFNETMEWFNISIKRQESTPLWEQEVLDPYILNLKIDNLRHHLYEMAKMKKLPEEEKDKEKEKNSKNNKEKKKIGDIDTDVKNNAKESKDLKDTINDKNESDL